MIILKIKKPGYTIAIPGLSPSRSPVEVDISKLDIRVVAMYLKSADISEYEIIADIGKGSKEVYTKKDFEIREKSKSEPYKKEVNKRFNKLEKMLSTLLIREAGKSSLEKEQITNKLNNLEKLLQKKLTTSFLNNTINNEPEVEELDSFIPDINVSDLSIKSKGVKTIKQDSDDLEDAADILSGLIKK